MGSIDLLQLLSLVCLVTYRTDHDINYLSSGQWITLNSITGNQVACGTDGSVYVTGWNDNAIYKWNNSTGFNVVSALGNATTDLAVYNASSIIKLDSGIYIFHWDNYF